MEKDKKICPITTSKAEQMICCNSKKLDDNVIKPLYSNQSAGKSVHISFHMMCWYELTVQFFGASTGRVEWPSSTVSVLPVGNVS